MDEVALLAAAPRRQEPRPHLWPFIFVACIALSIAVAFLGDRGQNGDVAVTTATPEREARVYLVSYRYGVFSPTNLRIHTGDTVRWRNDDTTPIKVSAQVVPGQRVPLFASEMLSGGDEFTYTFSVPGVFGYENTQNPNESGVIIVR